MARILLWRSRDWTAGRDPVTSDRLVRLRGPRSRTLYPDTLRVVRYVDPATDERRRFLTNHQVLDAPTIALWYRKRWRATRWM